MRKHILCADCKKELTGRADKKFCDEHCRSAYHYKLRQQAVNFYTRVDKQLKKNRLILKQYNKAGKATVRTQS